MHTNNFMEGKSGLSKAVKTSQPYKLHILLNNLKFSRSADLNRVFRQNDEFPFEL